MGLFQAKNRVIQAAAVLLALFALPAYSQQNNTAASTMNRAPASSPMQEGQAPAERASMAQADAFSSAGEQASFLGAYQMWYGPYGTSTDDKPAREKLIRETAQAIDECLKGSCSEEKQKKVLKALTQYNFGQDIKRMMLTNNTNHENMASLDNSGDARAIAHKQGLLNQAEIEASLGKGMDFTVDTSDPVKPKKSKVASGASIQRGSMSDKQPIFQMDDAAIRPKHIDASYLAEREILGDKFLKDYGAFLDGYESLRAPTEAQYYQYVPAKDGTTRVYTATPSVNRERFADAQSTQNNPHIRKIYENYRRNLKPIVGRMHDDGKVYRDDDGSTPEDLGFGTTIAIDPAQYPEVDFKDLMQDGKIPEANRGKAIARAINLQFRKAAEERQKQESAKRSIASKDPAPRTPVITTLTPESFDEFLDQIWPSSAERQRIVSSAPPADSDAIADPAQVDGQAPSDRRDMRPTDQRGKRPRPMIDPKYYQTSDGE
jgi:hypothetical protein